MTKKEDTTPTVIAPVERASAPVGQYRDKAYTSRTLVLPSGYTAKVMAGRITAASLELRSYLDKHPEFERIED